MTALLYQTGIMQLYNSKIFVSAELLITTNKQTDRQLYGFIILVQIVQVHNLKYLCEPLLEKPKNQYLKCLQAESPFAGNLSSINVIYGKELSEIDTHLIKHVSGVLYCMQVQSFHVLPLIQVAFNLGYGSAEGAQFPAGKEQTKY